MSRRIALLAASVVGMLACDGASVAIIGSGTLKTEDRPVGTVRRVSLATLGDLTITVGDKEALQVEAEDNLLPHIETTVESGELIIREAPDVDLKPTRSVRYRLAVTTLDALSTSSSGRIDAAALTASSLGVRISSGGDVNLEGLTGDKLDVAISSSGDLSIRGGKVKSQTVSLSSSGGYEAGDLRTEVAEVRISSSGSATIWVTNQLTADLGSSGNLRYYGTPQVTQKTSSSGKVIGLGEK